MATHAPAEVRRAQILDAALHCLADTGLHAAKVDDIAKRSGLSKGAIYWHFKSKEEIFLAVFDAFDQAVFAQWETIESDSAIDTLGRLGAATFATLGAARPLLDAWAEFFRHPEARGRMARVYVRARRRLATIVERGVASGELRPCDPTHVAAAITGLVEGLLLQAVVDPAFDPDAAWPEASRLLTTGLRSQG